MEGGGGGSHVLQGLADGGAAATIGQERERERPEREGASCLFAAGQAAPGPRLRGAALLARTIILVRPHAKHTRKQKRKVLGGHSDQAATKHFASALDHKFKQKRTLFLSFSLPALFSTRTWTPPPSTSPARSAPACRRASHAHPPGPHLNPFSWFWVLVLNLSPSQSKRQMPDSLLLPPSSFAGLPLSRNAARRRQRGEGRPRSRAIIGCFRAPLEVSCSPRPNVNRSSTGGCTSAMLDPGPALTLPARFKIILYNNKKRWWSSPLAQRSRARSARRPRPSTTRTCASTTCARPLPSHEIKGPPEGV